MTHPNDVKVGAILLAIILSLTAVGLIGCPKYMVWQKGLKGKATLAEADWDRQVRVAEAEAEKEAAVALAAAEVERAKGVAEANKIIGDSLKDNDSYLRYLWIQGLHDGSSEIIYVPTEAQLPILEAGRLNATATLDKAQANQKEKSSNRLSAGEKED